MMQLSVNNQTHSKLQYDLIIHMDHIVLGHVEKLQTFISDLPKVSIQSKGVFVVICNCLYTQNCFQCSIFLIYGNAHVSFFKKNNAWEK